MKKRNSIFPNKPNKPNAQYHDLLESVMHNPKRRVFVFDCFLFNLLNLQGLLNKIANCI